MTYFTPSTEEARNAFAIMRGLSDEMLKKRKEEIEQEYLDDFREEEQRMDLLSNQS